MEYRQLLVEKRSGVVAVTLNRPEKLNAIGARMVHELLEVVEQTRDDDASKVLLITGAGRGFCAGADLSTSDDGEAAFAFAAPIIRLKFGDAANFMTMVKTSFAAVYRPRKVTFGNLVAPELRLPVQRVYVVGPDGNLLAFDYVMERQAGGEWRIAGVYLHHMPSDGPT